MESNRAESEAGRSVNEPAHFKKALVLSLPQTIGAATLGSRHPGLATGPLKSAALAPLDEEQILGARYGIQSIPVQVFFDTDGNEVFRHVGFFAQSEMDRQLAKMGVKK